MHGRGTIIAGKIILALAALAAPAAAATPAAPAPATYDVTVTLRDGDAPATHPRLLVRAGEPATFDIGNSSYGLRLTARPESADRVALSSHIAYWTPEGLRHQAGDRVTRADGTPFTLMFQRTDPITRAVNEVSVEVSVRPAAD